MKKLVTILLIVIMIFAFGVVVSAEEDLINEMPTVEEVEEVEEPYSGSASVSLILDEEYTFNIEEGVLISVEGNGIESEERIQELGLEDMLIVDAVAELIRSFEELPEVVMNVYPEDEALLDIIVEGMTIGMMDESDLPDEEVEDDLEEVTSRPEFIIARFELAESLGLNPGRTHLLEKLNESTSEEINFEEWSELSVKEIMKAIKENRKDVEEEVEDLDEDVEPQVVSEPVQANNGNGNGKGKNKGKKK